MDRRQFFKLASAAGVVSFLPIPEIAEPAIWTPKAPAFQPGVPFPAPPVWWLRSWNYEWDASAPSRMTLVLESGTCAIEIVCLAQPVHFDPRIVTGLQFDIRWSTTRSIEVVMDGRKIEGILSITQRDTLSIAKDFQGAK